MGTSERVERAQATLEAWMRDTMGWGPDRAVVGHVPHLSTPHFDFFVLSQRGLGPPGELYAMSDGQEVLPSNRANLSKVLAREGFVQNPDVIPPRQFGELFFKMAEVRRLRLIEAPSDWALEGLVPDVRATFHAPTARREADPAESGRASGIRLRFWTNGPEPERVERWEVHVAEDLSLTHASERLK